MHQDYQSDDFESNAKAYKEHKMSVLKAKEQQAIIDLKNKIKIGIMTTMIGALDDFEKEFGALWGHGQKELTQEQKELKEKWETARESILDRGNGAIEKTSSHVNKYILTPRTNNKYSYRFKVGQDYENR